MAALGATFPTLVDVAKRMDPNGAVSKIAEVLDKYNPILDDMPFVEGNLPTGHRYTSRNALPSVTWRKFNQGIDATKSTTAQFDETCGMLGAISKVDVKLAALNGNSAAFRMSEDKAFLQALNQEVATGVFYHNISANPERFQGLTPRLNATSGNPASAQIIKADASPSGADQASIWLIGWGEDSVFGIYPKGSMVGMEIKDMGEQLVLDSNSKQFRAFVTDMSWQIGLCVKDYRYVARICNIDTSAWTDDLSAGADIALSMIDARAALFELNSVRPVYYMARSVFTKLQRQLVKRQANWLEWLDGSVSGKPGMPIPAFMGIPIKFVDALTITESAVT